MQRVTFALQEAWQCGVFSRCLCFVSCLPCLLPTCWKSLSSMSHGKELPTWVFLWEINMLLKVCSSFSPNRDLPDCQLFAVLSKYVWKAVNQTHAISDRCNWWQDRVKNRMLCYHANIQGAQWCVARQLLLNIFWLARAVQILKVLMEVPLPPPKCKM